MNWFPAERMTIYTQLAFASVVLATATQLTFNDRLVGQPWQVVLTFVICGLYVFFAALCNTLTDDKPRWRLYTYFVVQTGMMIAVIWFSPAKGFFAIIAFPIVSQAIFDLSKRGALLVILAVFGASVGVWVAPYGWGSAGRAAISYLPAYFFVIIFTILAREALAARAKAQKLADELSLANAQLRAYADEADELATTRERNRLAREIHDGVGHYLTVIKVQLDAAAALLPTDSARAATSIEKAARLAGEALDDVRRSVGSLATDAQPPAPLPETLRRLTADIAPSPELRIEGTPRPLASATEHALLRAAQEGLTNSRKHATATATTLTLDYRDPQRIRLSVTDNGRGAPPSGCATSGYGLRGLRERIALLGGSVTAGNRPEGGFSLTAEVPA